MARPPPASWRMIPRPLLETILNNHAHHHRLPQLLLFHGPRGCGKSSLLRHRLLPSWSQPPHYTAFVDFSSHSLPPWSLSYPPSAFPDLKNDLESALENLILAGIKIGAISSANIFKALNKNRGMLTALRRITGREKPQQSESKLWHKAVFDRIGSVEIDVLGDEVAAIGGLVERRRYVIEETQVVREGVAALRVAKEVVEMMREWRREAVRQMNRSGRFAKSLVDSATDWPILLAELLSQAAEIDFFQPKLVINNIDVLRKATTTDDTMVHAGMYHDSFIWRLIALGVNERCLPVILVTSDGYYSYQAFVDFGFPDIFLSRETFGWSVPEAKLHMVPDYFTETEWKVIDEVLGPNPRHLSELYRLKKSTQYQELTQDRSSFEDVVDAYLAYLQVTVVNPAMESALVIIQNFAVDVREGKVLESRLQFGAPWRHPPLKDDPAASLKWAKIQLMDFVQSLVNTEFGSEYVTSKLHLLWVVTCGNGYKETIKVNYLSDYSLEILNDPSAVALMEVGLLYVQRDPSFIRPIARGIQRCLARWLVQERMQMSFHDYIPYLWQRIIRGRSYRHLMNELGYK